MLGFSFTRRQDRRAAADLYAACARASRQPVLFLRLGVPDTLQGRFESLTLHLFPVLHRLMHDPGDDRELATLVSEAFVADMDAAMREMGVGDVTVPKRMKRLYGSFAGRISAYEAGLQGGLEPLAAAIARNVLEGAQEGSDRALARYVRAMVAACREAPLDALRRGEVPLVLPEAPDQEGSA